MLDIATSCRTCMESNLTMINLFQPIQMQENHTFHLADALMECTTTQVAVNDGLPQNMCLKCVKQLKSFYTFRNQVSKTEEELRKLILSQAVKDEPLDTYCNDNLDNDNGFYDDVAKSENEEICICDVCNQQFSNTVTLMQHLDSHKHLKCVYCYQLFPNKSLLHVHMLDHNQFICSSCGQTYDNESLLLNHGCEKVKCENINNKNVQCNECNLCFNTLRSLSIHISKKHKIKDVVMLQCDVCKAELSSKSLLRRHLKLHKSLEFHCTKCNKKYSRADQLKQHMNKHDNIIKKNICQYCNKGFTQLCSLKEHIRIHTGETPFLCSECGKGFSNRSNLRQHTMRHSGLKPFACKLCPKTFCTKGQMRHHMAVHTDDHPHKCSECDATFTQPNSLKKHRLIHLGIKAFACDACPMRFSTRDHLRRHYRKHTGEKPYKCTHCERSFRQSNDMLKHLRIHVGNNIYQCKVCYQSFRLAGELKRHYPVHYVGQAPVDHSNITITFNPHSPSDELAGDITIDISPETS